MFVGGGCVDGGGLLPPPPGIGVGVKVGVGVLVGVGVGVLVGRGGMVAAITTPLILPSKARQATDASQPREPSSRITLYHSPCGLSRPITPTTSPSYR